LENGGYRKRSEKKGKDILGEDVGKAGRRVTGQADTVVV
jgi:hypothetical protein